MQKDLQEVPTLLGSLHSFLKTPYATHFSAKNRLHLAPLPPGSVKLFSYCLYLSSDHLLHAQFQHFLPHVIVEST